VFRKATPLIRHQCGGQPKLLACLTSLAIDRRRVA
jgi:hypothetical protein